MLFIKLTGGPFFQGQFFFKSAGFWLFRTYNGFRNCECGVKQVKSVFLIEMGAKRLGRLSALPSKRRRFILAYNSQPKFGRTFGTCLHKLRYKIISE